MSAVVPYVGSPVVLVERLLGGTETSAAFEGMVKLLSSGVLEKSNEFGRKSGGGLEIKQSMKHPGVFKATGLENVKKADASLVNICFVACS